MSEEQQQEAQKDTSTQTRKKNALDNEKLSLRADLPGSNNIKSRLVWALVNNNPRVIVYTNDPQERDDKSHYGRITANLDAPAFFSFLQLFERVIQAKEEIKFKIENYGHQWENDQKSEERSLLSELWLGKDREGIVWLSVVAANRPKIKFPFTFPDYHSLYHGDGTVFTESESSVLVAKAWLGILQSVYAELLVSEYSDTPRPSAQRSGGYQKGGNYNRGGQGQGGSNYNRGNNYNRDGGGNNQRGNWNRDGGGYNKGGYNKGGYQKGGYQKDGYNKGGYNRDQGSGGQQRQSAPQPEVESFDDIPF